MTVGNVVCYTSVLPVRVFIRQLQHTYTTQRRKIMDVLLEATFPPMNSRCQSVLHSFMLRLRTNANLLLDLEKT